MSRLSNIMQIRRNQILFIAIAICGIYYPALSAGFCSLDDLSLIHHLTTSKFSWSNTFIPGNGLYYRPLLKLTYRFDQWAWGLNPALMHLENILLHLTNTMLVFAIAERFFRRQRQSLSYGPALAALLFGLHPLATESVNWISGRTDPLATLFVFLSMLVLFHALETKRYRWLLLASLLGIVAAMAKEVMSFSLPAGLVLIGLYPQDSQTPSRKFDRWKAWVTYGLLPLLMFGIFLAMRWGIRGEDAMGFTEVATRNRNSLPDLVRIFFKVWGFYVKKLFWPMPLNFALTDIGNHYTLLGLTCLGGLLCKARRNYWLWTPWLMAALLLVPAYFISIANVTWTPLAERYAYLASAFWSIGLIGFLNSIPAARWHTVFTGSLILFLLGSYVFVTTQRNQIWQDNLLLFADTIKKSPEHIGVRNELGNALLSRGYITEAKIQFETGLTATKVDYLPLTLNLARVYLLLQQPGKARTVLLAFMERNGIKHAPLPLLEKLALADERLLAENGNSVDKLTQCRELLNTYSLLYEKMNNPAYLFRSGQLARYLGDREKAAEFFSRAYATAPLEAAFREQARKLAAELGGG